ncbi:MAG: DUF2225 domain-containing protein [Candidatus Lokiarchaeota archaeon]|nr:DUF2225 domain-containing protein [Candidatus Lokiarchaeota archaeon]
MLMTTFASINITCAVCKKNFDSNEIASCGFASKRTDFRPNYWGFNPVEYFYHLCPHCGFCATKKIHEMNLNIKNIKRKIDELGFLEQTSLSQKLERAIKCIEILNELEILTFNDFSLANSWLQLYWWSETEENTKKYGRIVLEYFSNALAKNQVPDDQIITTKYLMGEINRRIGNKIQSLKIFDEVISLYQNNTDLKQIYDLAKQQKTNPKENL